MIEEDNCPSKMQDHVRDHTFSSFCNPAMVVNLSHQHWKVETSNTLGLTNQ
jgi:hypothetical protein